MNILFISNDLIAGNLAYILKKEGNSVKLYIDDKNRKNNFENLVTKTRDWEKELKWVGKDGLIIFDDVGYGTIQDKLRKDGYSVFGGSEASDLLESDRKYGQDIFREYGLQTVTLVDFDSIINAIEFVKENPSPWVIKQNNHHFSKVINYVGQRDDGKDVIDMLENYAHHPDVKNQKISLHKKITGIEIGVGRYFNGTDWIGPIELNVEYPRFFPGDIGPMTSEMGTLAWYTDDENNFLFKEVLSKLKPFLIKTNFRGDFEINCIINKEGIFPLEATTRFGSPIIHLQVELHESPWGEFLKAIANGERYNLKWKKGYGIVVLCAVPPLPYGKEENGSLVCGAKIYFENFKESDFEHVHFEEVSLKENQYYISDSRGYILYVTSCAETILSAQEKVYDLIKNIHIPKMFYRNDIGSSFIENEKKLKEWKYL